MSNGLVELTVLLGGGHLADFRLCGSGTNVLWESPWPTIEPQSFCATKHAELYGDGAAARMLCGYTGHALVLGYFGMPGTEEEKHGLPLHGELTNREWRVVESRSDANSATLTLEAESPSFSLRLRRTLTLAAGSQAVRLQESVANYGISAVDFQWVQHAAFGEPMLARGESSLIVPAGGAVTWPLGYEDRPLLRNDAGFLWPDAPALDGGTIDLSNPFAVPGTGFVAAALLDPSRSQSFVAACNRRLGIVAGYCFERRQFPWVALWEENAARATPPWNGNTRVRGVEFGNSPMPLGLDWAKHHPTLLGTPTFSRLAAGEALSTGFHLFVSALGPGSSDIGNVTLEGSELRLFERGGLELALRIS